MKQMVLLRHESIELKGIQVEDFGFGKFFTIMDYRIA